MKSMIRLQYNAIDWIPKTRDEISCCSFCYIFVKQHDSICLVLGPSLTFSFWIEMYGISIMSLWMTMVLFYICEKFIRLPWPSSLHYGKEKDYNIKIIALFDCFSPQKDNLLILIVLVKIISFISFTQQFIAKEEGEKNLLN